MCQIHEVYDFYHGKFRGDYQNEAVVQYLKIVLEEKVLCGKLIRSLALVFAINKIDDLKVSMMVSLFIRSK